MWLVNKKCSPPCEQARPGAGAATPTPRPSVYSENPEGLTAWTDEPLFKKIALQIN